jgi:tungstate transport system substrate-binding protein
MADWNRRDFLKASAAGVAVSACKGGTAGEPDPSVVAPPVNEPPADAHVIRVCSVPTSVEGNLLPQLVEKFEALDTHRVELKMTTDVYGQARAGKVDLAISHYGHREAEQFVVDGLGEWPRTVFSNQVALVGPSADPANIRGLLDGSEALHRIAATGSPFVLNELHGLQYLMEILWYGAGRPDRTPWIRGHTQDAAIREAAKRGAYTMWGLTPFLRLRKAEQLPLEPLVVGDPLFQRLIVSIIVKPSIVGVNADGARAFQQFLLQPETQATMRTIDYANEPGARIATWQPAGWQNRVDVLPKPKT